MSDEDVDAIVTVPTLELVELAGCTYRQADYWTRTGLLRPLDRQARSRRYPMIEVRVARALTRLRVMIDEDAGATIAEALRAGRDTVFLAGGAIGVDLDRLTE